jgi:hypothetical protein
MEDKESRPEQRNKAREPVPVRGKDLVPV